jgi:hypothetical protein
MVKTEAQIDFFGINGEFTGNGLHRLIAVCCGSIGTGIVLLTLRGNPAKNVFTLGIAYPASPVHGNIAPRRHSLMLHNPFNFV